MGNACASGNKYSYDIEDLAIDKQIGNIGMRAVQGGQDTISNEVLDLALGEMATLKQRVSLTFECSNLPNLDKRSKSDAICVLFQMNGNQKSRLGDTEIIPDSLNPKWVKSINVDYYFEAQQQFRVEIYDVDNHNALGQLQK